MSFLMVVDDNRDLRFVVCQMLRLAGHEVGEAPDGKSALEAIEKREPDLLVLDLSMPHMNGLELCSILKSNPFTARIPILMLTAQSEIEFKLQGFQAGADDYLAKPFEPLELKARVQALLRLVQRESQRNPSSGLPGGRAIESEIARRLDEKATFGVIYFDLDHFKPYADAFGFAVADATIAATGKALRRAITQCGAPGDFAGHIGGDDFIVVTSNHGAENIAQNTVQSIVQFAAQDFLASVSAIIGPEAAASGTFRSLNRDGHEQEFALAKMSAVVLLVAPEKYQSLSHLGRRAAELKQKAKTQGAGSFIVAPL